MSVGYKDIDLFGSGPWVCVPERRGQQMVPRSAFSSLLPGSESIGPLEAIVVVTGRLVATSVSGLQEQLDDVAAQLALYPEPGSLESADGRVWTGMSLARFEPAGAVDFGRAVSLAYTAKFYRLLT